MYAGRCLIITVASILIAIMLVIFVGETYASWNVVSSMSQARKRQISTRLVDGKILVAGGENSTGYLAAAEKYDSVNNTWSAAGTMVTARRGGHTATLLLDGRVLVVGGVGVENSLNGILASSELYDPLTNSWSLAASLTTARWYHSATLLADGRVLVTGGTSGTGSTFLTSSEIYDPTTNTWNAAGSLTYARYQHSATLLSNGKVLVAGGQGSGVYPKNAELYDVTTNSWVAAGSLTTGRSVCSATQLTNGKVLIVGGETYNGTYTYFASAELYDPTTNDWSAVSSLSTARSEHTSELLSNGKVLVTGGRLSNTFYARSELYDPTANSWSTGTALTMSSGRISFSTTILPSGSVIATGGQSSSGYLASVEIYDLIPNKPTGQSTTNVIQTSITVNWGAVSDATGYFLDVATDSGFTSFVGDLNNKNIGNVTSYSVTGLAAGTSYYYRLKAYNSDGVSAYSTTVTQITIPATPTASTSTSPTTSGLTANWGFVNSATGYRLDVSTDSTFSTFVTGYNNKDVGNVTSYALSGLTGTTYYYRVRAYNTGGTSPNSNSISTTLPRPPVAPVSTSATNLTQTGFATNWNAVADSTGYYIDVATNSTFTTFATGYNNKDVGNVLSASITGLSSGTTYYYRVRAYNSYGISSSSNTISQTTYPAIPPTPPMIYVGINVSQTGFTLQWDASGGGATGYRIDVSTTSGFTSYLPGFNNLDVGNVTSYDLSGLTPGTSYYYRIRSYNALGASSLSTMVTEQSTLPTTPIATSATSIINTGFTANWGAVGSNSYYFDVATDSNFTTFVTGYNNKPVSGSSSFTVTGLSPVTTYYYRVRASVMGAVTPNSNVILVTTMPTKPAAPNASSATTVTYTGFMANWIASNNTTGYYLDLSTNSSFSGFVAGYENLDLGNVTTFNIGGLNPNTTYYYRLRAYNNGGASANSNTIMQATLSDLSPPVVIDFTIPVTATSLDIAIKTFTATDNRAVVGYMLSETPTQPSISNSSWTINAPTTYRFTSQGARSLYAFAMDAVGNVSAPLSAAVTITLADTIAPVVTSFTIPTIGSSLTVPITAIVATDTVGVASYLISENAAQPQSNDQGWVATLPTQYVFTSQGAKTLYAFAKDAAGNISPPLSANVTITLPDTIAPIVSGFTIPATAASLSIPISALTATDAAGVTGYLLSETSAAPQSNDQNWSQTLPTQYVFTSQGVKTLYAFAKDAAGNISAPLSANVTISLPDATAPVVSEFSIPATASNLIISVTTFSATDSTGVTGYYLSETSTPPLLTDTHWTTTPTSSFTFTSAGSKTLYAFAKDAAGNISVPVSDAVTITLADTTVPTITVFSMPTTATGLTVPVTNFAANDNTAVTGYVLTESATAPQVNILGWSSTAPNAYTFNSAGTKILFAWAKDAAGNVSAPITATISITLSDTIAPTVTSFDIPATSSSLIVPVTTFSATDNVAVTGYLLSEVSTPPIIAAQNWASTSQRSYTFSSAGSKTLYAFAKDAVGNIAPPITDTVTITLPPPQFIVTPTNGLGYSISPAIGQMINENATTSFTVLTLPGYGIYSVTGCNGSLNGSTLTTGAITANCTINITTVKRSATSIGSSSPTIVDALKVLQAFIGESTLSDAERIRYDVAPLGVNGIPQGNGIIDGADVILILRRSIGIGSW